MNQENLHLINKIFNNETIRTVWDKDEEKYFISIVDIVGVISQSKDGRKYWNKLKQRLKQEGNESVTNCHQLKLKSSDGKYYNTDVLDTKGILRLIESVPSPKAEPFKMWLASLGNERIDEVFDPEIAINRAINYYRSKGYSDEFIETRLKGILSRKKLTDVWKENGIKDNYEYGILTNEIYKTWSGMKANEYKKFKNLRKESLRDNMTDIEVALTDLGEIATRELVKKHKPYGLSQNKEMARRGGNIAKITRNNLEKELGTEVISDKNKLNYQYIDDSKLIEPIENNK